jgi:hypothetical protein
MKCYFITRFSIYHANYGGFQIARNHDPKEYERRLFDKARLDEKLNYFQNITLPSIVGQTCGEWKWHIYTSDRLPDEHMKRLRSLADGHENISVIPVKDLHEFYEQIRKYDYGASFATVRLDDDDGLALSYVEKLQQYSTNVGSIVSMTEGRLVKYTEDRGVVMGEKISRKNLALGLAGIGLMIFDCGAHSTIHERFNVIYDASPDMYLLACSPFTDTMRPFNMLDRVTMRLGKLLSSIFS